MTWTPPAKPVNWQDLPSTGTALDAANLNADEAYGATVGTSVVTYFEGGSSSTVPVATAFLMPSGGDDSAKAATAITAGGTIVLGPGTFLWNTTVPGIAPSKPTRIVGAGVGKTIIKLSTGARRFLDLAKTADYQTFNDIEISDLTVDCNSVGGQHHVILGTYAAGVQMTKINLARVAIRRVQTLNVPTDPTAVNHRLNVWLYAEVLATDTPCTMTDITVEDFDFGHGGNIGIGIGGTASSGSATGGLTHDRVLVQRGVHDTGQLNTGAAYSSYAVQIGSRDTGITITVRDVHSFNSGDLGIGLLNSRYGQCEDCTSVDARTLAFQAANFNPSMPGDQTHNFKSCHHRLVSLNPINGGAYPAAGFGGTGSPNQQLGHVILDSCSSHSLASNVPPPGTAISVVNPLQSLTILGEFHMDYAAISHSLGGNYVGGLVQFSPTGRATFTVRGALRSNVLGTITLNAHTFSFTETFINPPANGDYTLDVEDHLPKISITNATAGSCIGVLVGPTSIPGTTTVTGTTANTTGNVTGLSAADIAKVTPGDPVTGTGIPASQTVQSVNVSAGSFVFGPSVASASASVTITVTPLACVRGRWRYDWQGDNSGDTAPIGASVQKWGTPGRTAISGAFMAIAGRLAFDNSNATRMPAGSAGNGNILGSEIVDTGNAANAMPLVTYHGIRPANALQKSLFSTFSLANGVTTINNQFGRRYQIWLSVAATAVTFIRGTDVTPQAAVATSGPFYMEPGDQIAVTTAGGSYYRLPTDV